MFQLGCVPAGEEYAGRVSIPYLTPAGVVDMKYRCANLEHGDHKGVSCVKYGKESGLGVHLFNARALIGNADTAILTEGEFDAIAIQAFAGIPAVAYPGVETWQKQEHWRLCFDGLSEVIVIADGDEPGRKSASRVADSLGRLEHLSVRTVDMQDGMDANQFITQFGIPEFLKKVQQ